MIGKIDYGIQEFRGFMSTNSIFNEPFSAGIPRETELRVKQTLQAFGVKPNSKNFNQLLSAFNTLVDLNKDLWWVIKTCGE